MTPQSTRADLHVAAPLHPGLEALEDGLYMLDAEWRVTYWNAAAARFHRAPRETVLGRVLWERFPYLRETPTWELLHRAVADRASCRFLEPHPTGSGPGRFSVRATPLEGGGLTVHFRDATEEVLLAERYSGLLESIRDGFLAFDAEGRIVYVNSVAESLLRLARERATGTVIWSLLPSQPPEIAHSLRATMEDGMQRHLREIRPEGRVFRGRVYDLWIYPLPGGGASLLFEDVSDRIRREKELARFAMTAQEANRAKSRFFAAVSHELRTPLNAIVGYTHLLSTETYGTLPAAAKRAADRAGVCAEHLARLVDDVLLMTTAEIGRLPVSPTGLRLPTFLEETAEPIRHQAEAKGLRFVLDVEPEAGMLETDPDRLRQLLVALLSNAVKFTPQGEVRVEARSCTGGEPGEGWLEITVADTGPGIPAEDRERVFQPFEQLGDPARSDSLTRGTGLGLTVARQLCGLLCGELHLEVPPRGGSVFRLRVPRRFPARL